MTFFAWLSRFSKLLWTEEAVAEAGEICPGCGAASPRHPMVGVAMDRKTESFVVHPVCNACWREPSHRVAPLKMHFFPRSHAASAVARAGSSDIGG
jgi:hypothetical protein